MVVLFLVFDTEKPTVVVVLKDLDTQYFEIVKAGAEKGFRDFGLNGTVVAPSYESEEDVQENLLHTILNEDPDVLIVSPVASDIIPTLRKFVKRDIPVLLLDTNYPWIYITSYIGTNNYELGRMGGMLLASSLQPGNKVALLAGELSHPISRDRIKGAKVSLGTTGIEIVEIVDLPNETAPVKEAMETVLQEHPDIKGVYTVTDIMALSVFNVIEEYGVSIPIVGADGINEMIELVEEGLLPGTVAQNPYDMGYFSIEAALKAINGEKVERNMDSGVDVIIKGNAKQRLEFQKRILK
jgi:ribose transport system substrate-binding protein